ncbi:hypothetical protein J6590_001358 [Homalodisca vitripennis]|nr:hypothetical protein J6590_001358 [Homalodisca vitripennis]
MATNKGVKPHNQQLRNLKHNGGVVEDWPRPRVADLERTSCDRMRGHNAFAGGVQQLLEHIIPQYKSTVIVVPASRFFSKLQNGGALPRPLPVLPDTSATDELTRRFSSFTDCGWNCCVYVVKLVFDILGRCVVCTRNGLSRRPFTCARHAPPDRTCTRIRVSRRTTR